MVLLHNGQVIRDTYVVDRLLGRGAFAELYRAEYRFLGRQAMKVFRNTRMSAPARHMATIWPPYGHHMASQTVTSAGGAGSAKLRISWRMPSTNGPGSAPGSSRGSDCGAKG